MLGIEKYDLFYSAAVDQWCIEKFDCSDVTSHVTKNQVEESIIEERSDR